MFTTFVDNSECLFEYFQRNIEKLMKPRILSSVAIIVAFFVFLFTTEFNLANLVLLLNVIIIIIISLIEKIFEKIIVNSRFIIGISMIKPFLLAICLFIILDTIKISDSRYFVIYQSKIITVATIIFAISIFLLTPYFYNLRKAMENELPIDIKASIFIPVFYTIFLLSYNFIQNNENFSLINAILFGLCLLVAFVSLRKSMYLFRIYISTLNHTIHKIE